jgi:small nuclear ribonucleoprotein (snRNP)-like protein
MRQKKKGPGLWRFLNKDIVVDTNSSYLYIGTFVNFDEDFIELKDVDVHDSREGQSTKERYIMEAKKFGTKPNRKSVSIFRDSIVSVSSIQDIIEY